MLVYIFLIRNGLAIIYLGFASSEENCIWWFILHIFKTDTKASFIRAGFMVMGSSGEPMEWSTRASFEAARSGAWDCWRSRTSRTAFPETRDSFKTAALWDDVDVPRWCSVHKSALLWPVPSANTHTEQTLQIGYQLVLINTYSLKIQILVTDCKSLKS